MLYATYKKEDGTVESYIYNNGYEDVLLDDLIENKAVLLEYVELKLKGQTYAERQESVRDAAISWSHCCEQRLSWGELATISNWFEMYGRLYGLMTEFHEEGIC